MFRKLTCLLFLVLLLGVAAGSATAELIAYYPFDEGQGTTTVDDTDNGNDGTFNGDVEWVPGFKGTGVHFDTGGDRILIGEIDPTAANDAMTLAAWINWEGLDHSISQQGIIGKREGWDPGTNVKWFWQVQPSGALLFRADWSGGGAGLWWGNTYLVPYANEWAHVALTWDDGAAVQYINGEEVSTGNVTFQDTADDTIVSIGCVSATNNESFVGTIDEVRIYDTALTAAEIAQAMQPGAATTSSAPMPPSGATDVRTDVVLSWTRGELAASHDVYFGTSFDDVNAASTTDDRGVLASPGHSGTSYDPEGLLDIGQTYYWRVDDVNAPPNSTVFRGPIWSFMVEPYAYPLANVTATASSSAADKGMTPDKTVDGSGMNAADEHVTEETDMWLTEMLTVLPAWIQYEFDQVHTVDEMWVWNSNQSVEDFIGFGAKDVTVEYSLDGVEWSLLREVQLTQAPGQDGYGAYDTVDMEGVQAKFVRLTITSNWSLYMQQTGLSEVRFLYVPIKAREPEPAVGVEDVDLDAVLAWRPGRGSAAHEVYVSSDRAAVADGTALLDTTETLSYDLSGAGLEYGQTVYWKINELDENGAVLAAGDIWSFSTTEYFVVDDFESYTNEVGNRVFQTWIDGWGFTEPAPGHLGNGTGATVGHDIWSQNSAYFEGDIVETDDVHGGRQAMPLYYNNTEAPFYSETERTWTTAQNWSANGATELSLWFRGNPGAFVETSPGNITISGAGADIYNQTDEFRFAYKQLTGDGSITARIESLENTHVWAKAGVMIREGLTPGARQVHMIGTPDNRMEYMYREFANGTTSAVATDVDSTPLPHWVRITRQGSTITGEYSADGVSWEMIVASDGTSSTKSITMIGTIYIGLAVCSHVFGVGTVAEFSNVQTGGGVSGAWQVEAIGVAQPANDRDDLYLVVEDSGGRSKVMVYPDAVLLSDWTQWKIPLSEFTDAGVNVATVKKMYIGVGNRTAPAPSGTGVITIDDIRVGREGVSDPGSSGLLVYCALENDPNDSSGNGNDGTLAGDPNFPVAYVDGAVGTGMLFDGTYGHEHVALGTFNPSEATGQLSVSLWANWNGLSGQYQGLIGKRDSWDAADMMWDLEANRDTGVLRFGRNGSTVGTGDAVLPEGEWQHVAVTFDGAEVTIYVAGEVRGSGTTFSFGTDTEANVQFGCGQVNGGNPFNGALDEVRIYDRALSWFEIVYLARQ